MINIIVTVVVPVVVDVVGGEEEVNSSNADPDVLANSPALPSSHRISSLHHLHCIPFKKHEHQPPRSEDNDNVDHHCLFGIVYH